MSNRWLSGREKVRDREIKGHWATDHKKERKREKLSECVQGEAICKLPLSVCLFVCLFVCVKYRCRLIIKIKQSKISGQTEMRLDWTATVFTHSKCEATNYPIDKTKKMHVRIQKVVRVDKEMIKVGRSFFLLFFTVRKQVEKVTTVVFLQMTIVECKSIKM